MRSNCIYLWFVARSTLFRPMWRCDVGRTRATAIGRNSFDFIIIFNGTSNRCGGKFHNKFSRSYVSVRVCVCVLVDALALLLVSDWKIYMYVRTKIAFSGENSDASWEVHPAFEWAWVVTPAAFNSKVFFGISQAKRFKTTSPHGSFAKNRNRW